MPVKPQKPYKFSQKSLEPLLAQLFREIEDHYPALDKDGDVVLEKDIHCRRLFVDDESIYIGGVKLGKPTLSENGYYLKFDSTAKELVYAEKATPVDESVQDIVGAMFSGNTETLISATYQDSDGTIDLVVDEASIDHDALTNFVPNEHLPGIDEDDMVSDSATSVPTQQSVKAYVDAVLPSIVCSGGNVAVNDGEVVWQS